MGSDRPVLTLSSIFRDSEEYLDRYFAQIDELEQVIGPVRLVIAEGDSEDLTYKSLRDRMRDRDTLLYRPHHGRKFGSVDNPERWAQIAYVCNSVMDAMPSDDTPKVYVESDLIWHPHTIVTLLEDLAEVPAVAPMSMKDGRFYDIWGHRGLDGNRFTIGPPYHVDLEATEDDLVEIGSAGSCVAMRPDIAKLARFGANDCMVGLGRSIRYECGGSLYVDKRIAVIHP